MTLTAGLILPSNGSQMALNTSTQTACMSHPKSHRTVLICGPNRSFLQYNFNDIFKSHGFWRPLASIFELPTDSTYAFQSLQKACLNHPKIADYRADLRSKPLSSSIRFQSHVQCYFVFHARWDRFLSLYLTQHMPSRAFQEPSWDPLEAKKIRTQRRMQNAKNHPRWAVNA